jgi:hypothetical protein
MAEDYEFIYKKLGELILNSQEVVGKRLELLDIYSIEGELGNFLKKYLTNGLTDISIPNLEENLENYEIASFNYYDSLIEKRSLLKVFGELSPYKDLPNSRENFRILEGDLEEEILDIRGSLKIATTNSFLIEFLRKINNS